MRVIILLGAPGAGKGTAAEGIKAQTNYLHISTGDILREAVKQGTPVGKRAEAFMKRGELVPDAIMMQVVEERLGKGSPDDCYMFDGFPRTKEQAELLAASLARRNAAVNFVFFLDAPREVLISRLAGRLICRACGANYHAVNIPPRKAGVCDACGGELYQRPDDMEATVVNRLDVFRRQTEGLIAYYKQQGVLVCLDGAAQPRQKTVAEIVSRLRAAERA
jgi:adenylate kinase